MINPIATVMGVAKNEKRALVGVAASFVIWWYFMGRKKYGTKGMSRYV